MVPSGDLILQHINEAIFMLDADGYIMYTNPYAAQLTGYTATELLNKHIAILSPDADDRIQAEYDLALANKKGVVLSETLRKTKDGNRFWSELTLKPLANGPGNQNGYTAILRDVSERKQAELALRRNEERYRLMVEGVTEYAIFMLDPNGYIVTWNEGAKRIKGYLPNEIIGKHFSIFYTAEDLQDKKPERELKIAIATGRYEEVHWRVRKNGSLFWANVVITALFNEDNKHIGFSKVTRDLTDRKQKEEALRQSEERYRSLVEQVLDYGIFMLDEKGRIISWNEGAKNINGYQAEEVIGKYFSIFYPEEDLANGKPAYELQVARKEGKYEEEGWRLRKDGSRFWANVVITAVYNTDGTLIGFSKVTRDLTERKESERALRESYERYRITADELKKTNTALAYTNQELEQFNSIVSHDLQEPIRTIKSFLQLIQLKLNGQEDEALKNYIAKSVNAASRMRELIQNLLLYTQLAKGELVEEEIDVKELVDQVLQNLKNVVEQSGAQITTAFGVKRLTGDRVQLTQLLQNLIINALKFTEAATPTIHIQTGEAAGHVKFSVSDNGIGIAAGDDAKIFEIFRRLSTKKASPGTGIGLAICKKIVERHRGNIWPESQPGKGTTFHFTLHEK